MDPYLERHWLDVRRAADRRSPAHDLINCCPIHPMAAYGGTLDYTATARSTVSAEDQAMLSKNFPLLDEFFRFDYGENPLTDEQNSQSGKS